MAGTDRLRGSAVESFCVEERKTSTLYTPRYSGAARESSGRTGRRPAPGTPVRPPIAPDPLSDGQRAAPFRRAGRPAARPAPGHSQQFAIGRGDRRVPSAADTAATA
ncbi:hypothetical protein GCM10010259_14030 [Streptomyces daghestanicus]|uniref:Uncharacterized protein n=1 Tax=Streptomyces daghestanicus TaxID=66885 RepID=A0ABQ3PXM3_9ACTN|nr:hypothetical protein GCM10010240_37670 [Streptomyces griseoviridis]GGU24767.1 hypothetical protein GCM10010259_14030 [Streptomyces daghestanicus]GHI29776.1 hypothetical protein Sdagh_15060 [Streptomyces daghestanicus]